MMQATKNRRLHNGVTDWYLMPVVARRNLALGGFRDSTAEGSVGPASVVVDCPLFDSHPQMTFVDRDQEVDALAAQASAEPFTDRVGPGRPNGSSNNPHSEARQFLIQALGEDGVPVVDHETIGMIARKCLAELLQGPFRSWMDVKLWT